MQKDKTDGQKEKIDVQINRCIDGQINICIGGQIHRWRKIQKESDIDKYIIIS